jgi:two-component system chemotaxis response regulator CheY
MKILIAEDDTSSRLIYSAILRKLGHTVTAVETGQQALEAWQNGDYRLVISDWTMPDMDGLQLCKSIRAEPGRQYTYFILLTAKEGKGSYFEGMDAGADDFLNKPLDEVQLVIRLRVAERILELYGKLYAEATYDRLTGVRNRATIMDYLSEQLKRGDRENNPLSLIVADLDHFKQVNDTYGHPVGDVMLHEAAQRMRVAIRPYDMVGRYGGEEFLIIIPNCGRREALAIAERIRCSIYAHPVKSQAGEISMTVSLGVATSEDNTGMDPIELISAADKALYHAKKAGRNCLASHSGVTAESGEVTLVITEEQKQ